MVRPAELSVVALEQVMGIEPTRSAWEAEVLPLNYTCKWLSTVLLIHILSKSGENVNIPAHFTCKNLARFAGSVVFPALNEVHPVFSLFGLHMKERNPRSVSALFHQLFQLVLDPLERVVDALDMAAEHLRDFLIALAVQIRRQNPAFQRGKRLVDAAFNAHIAFPADEQLFRIALRPSVMTSSSVRSLSSS